MAICIRRLAVPSSDYDAHVAMRDEIFRRPLGLRIADDDLAYEARPDTYVLGAFEGPDLIGTCVCLVKDVRARVMKVRFVSVAERLRGRGIGALIMGEALRLARELGMREVTLDARISAQRFYERLGFETRGEPFVYNIPVKDHIEMVATLPEDPLLARLFAEADPAYRAFMTPLVPTVKPWRFIGVRTPALRRMARELAQRDSTACADFLARLPHTYFEENQLHAFALPYAIPADKDEDAAFAALDRFVPFLDNWATCDQLAHPVLASCPRKAVPALERWLASEHEYTRRFAIKTLLFEYLGERFDPRYLAWVAAADTGAYYVSMAVAWYVAEALARQPKDALALLESGTLRPWTHNKALQKARESKKVEPALKARLGDLKRPDRKGETPL